MKTIELGTIVTVVLAIIAGVAAFSRLQGKVEALKPDAIADAQKQAIAAIERARGMSSLPVGTVITSILPPEKFRTLPGYVEAEWSLRNDGKALYPSTAALEGKTPDLQHLDEALTVTGIIAVSLKHGENVSKLSNGRGSWTWFASPNKVQGNAHNADVEQDEDKFETYVDSIGGVVCQGSTYNRKHAKWGAWEPGTATVVGIDSVRERLHHYLKVQ